MLFRLTPTMAWLMQMHAAVMGLWVRENRAEDEFHILQIMDHTGAGGGGGAGIVFCLGRVYGPAAACEVKIGSAAAEPPGGTDAGWEIDRVSHGVPGAE
jgi:hypothetical protein